MAVLFACASALLFGAMTVSLRFALRRTPDAEAGSFVLSATGVIVTGLVVIAASRWGGTAWPFLLAGLLAPGASQIFFVRAVRAAGPARTAVLVGTAPLISVAIALVFLDEPFRLPLLAGAILVVLGSVALGTEPIRPEHFRAVGLLFAFTATVLFSTRDNLLRWLSIDTTVSPQLAAAATFASGASLIAAYLVATRGPRALADVGRAVPAFVGPGLLGTASYISLFEAYYRGRVTVVSPLVATESLCGVVIAGLLLRRSELVGRHIVLGALVVVAGGALIGAVR